MKATKTVQLSRQEIRTIGLAATTLAEIEQARQMLQGWQRAHPEEPQPSDVFEQLYMLEDAWRILVAEPAALAA